MSSSFHKLTPLAAPACAAALLLAVAGACSAAGAPAEQAGSTPTPLPALDAPAAAEADPTAAPFRSAGDAYNSNANMYLLFANWDYSPQGSLDAIEQAVEHNDKSMVPVMIEMLRFFGNWEVVQETLKGLSAITGEDFPTYSRGWHEWMEWLGRNGDEYAPPDGYVKWKSELMSLIDPRFGDFLLPAGNGSRVNVAEIAWGGVLPDGIPPLENAPVVAAGGQDYMLPSDRVFGVSINGEHRAYPLRIVNAHEMANDVLGGEPISLAY